MGLTSLIMKDAREHGLAFIALALGFVLIVLIALVQQASGAFNMSGFEVIRFALMTVIPLITFIVGNRLIVREYTGGTRRFVEALPINKFSPLLVKYLMGLMYISMLCVSVVLLAAAVASEAEDVNDRYLQLLLLKTTVIGLLIWSLVFFVSFTGRIRLVIYVVLGLTMSYLMNMPSFDETRFAPLAIMDSQLFIFERELLPVRDIIETVLVALAFVVAGFSLALFNEGSIAEKLGGSLSRRDMAAFALIGVGCLTVYSTMQKKWEVETYDISGSAVLRNESPIIAVSYIEEKNKVQAERIFAALERNLLAFQSDIGLNDLPKVQIALNTELESTEIEPDLFDGILITANYLEFDDFEHGMLQAIVMHHLLLSLTGARWDYETRHWLLDGFARWWAEGARTAVDSANNDELFALALLAKRRFTFEPSINPLLVWQTITDQFGFEAADALSYTAILYLEQEFGTDKIIELSADYINESVGPSSLESIKHLLQPDAKRFESIVGQPINEFTQQWLIWLESFAAISSIARLIESVPHLTGTVNSVVDEFGAYRLQASYTRVDKASNVITGKCVLRHQLTLAFAQETMIYERNRDRQTCVTDGLAHNLDSPYTSGDRVYVLLEYEAELFHRPIPILVDRVHVK